MSGASGAERRWKWLAAFLLWLVPALAWAQATGVNPTPGSVWTYLGATYGAAWQLGQAIPITTPQNFGCKGDGTSDDTACFNSAVSGVAGKTPLYLPCGKWYRVNQLSRLPANTAIIGCGKGLYKAGWLPYGPPNCNGGLMAGTANLPYLISTSNNDLLAGFCILDGAAGTNTSGKAVDMESICADGACIDSYNNTVDNLLIDGPCIGVAMSGRFNNITDNFIGNIVLAGSTPTTYCGGIRIGAYTNSNRTVQAQIYNNTVETNYTTPGQYGILFLDAGGPYLTNNDFGVAVYSGWLDPGYDLISIGSQSIQSINSTGNFFDFNVKAALQVDCQNGSYGLASGGSVFNGDWFASAGSAPGGTSAAAIISINDSGAGGCSIYGLQINNARITGSLGDGIDINTHSGSKIWDLSITNSHICDIQGAYGINMGNYAGTAGHGISLQNNRVGGTCDGYTATLATALNLGGNNFDLMITGNDFSQATNAYAINGANSPGGNSIIENNKGIDEKPATLSSLTSWPLNPIILYSGTGSLTLPTSTYCCPRKYFLPSAGNITLSGALSVASFTALGGQQTLLKYQGVDWWPK